MPYSPTSNPLRNKPAKKKPAKKKPVRSSRQRYQTLKGKLKEPEEDQGPKVKIRPQTSKVRPSSTSPAPKPRTSKVARSSSPTPKAAKKPARSSRWETRKRELESRTPAKPVAKKAAPKVAAPKKAAPKLAKKAAPKKAAVKEVARPRRPFGKKPTTGTPAANRTTGPWARYKKEMEAWRKSK